MRKIVSFLSAIKYVLDWIDFYLIFSVSNKLNGFENNNKINYQKIVAKV